MTLPPFHLAFPVDDLAAARAFYGGVMGCREGRSSDEWVDFDFHGHQIVAHLAPGQAGDRARNHVDGHGVPVPHFGLVLAMEQWKAFWTFPAIMALVIAALFFAAFWDKSQVGGEE